MKTTSLSLFPKQAALFAGACAVVAMAGFVGVSAAHASAIASDDFNNNGSPYAGGTSLTGLKPDLADLPGTSYSIFTQNSSSSYAQPGIDTVTGNPTPSADTGFNAATYLNIASANGYTLPASITFSADIMLDNIQMSTGNLFRGVGLGFAAAVEPFGTNDASTNFTGLVVNPDGTLRLVTPGANSSNPGVGSVTYYAAPFAGFSRSAFYNLTYTVDLTTGSITSVNFNGNNDTAAFSGATGLAGFQFSSISPTVLASFYGSTDISASYFGQVDNFSVSSASAVPEPASLVLLGLGALGLLMLRKRQGKIT